MMPQKRINRIMTLEFLVRQVAINKWTYSDVYKYLIGHKAYNRRTALEYIDTLKNLDKPKLRSLLFFSVS